MGEYGHAPKNWQFFCQDLETRLPDFYRKIPAIGRISLPIYGRVSAMFSHGKSCQCYHVFTCKILSSLPCFDMVTYGILFPCFVITCYHVFPFPVAILFHMHMVTIDSSLWYHYPYNGTITFYHILSGILLRILLRILLSF